MTRKPVYVTILGKDRLTKTLERIPREIREPIRAALIANAMNVHGAAVASIMNGPATGKIYKRGGRVNPRSIHQASAPGEAPMSDSGHLASFLRWIEGADGLSTEVGTDDDYGAFLEFGTSEMEARPWLVPAFESVRPQMVARLIKAVRATMAAFEKTQNSTGGK